jgi:hypothetical protein
MVRFWVEKGWTNETMNAWLLGESNPEWDMALQAFMITGN